MVASAARKRERRLKFGEIKINDAFVAAADSAGIKNTRKRKIELAESKLEFKSSALREQPSKKSGKVAPGSRVERHGVSTHQSELSGPKAKKQISDSLKSDNDSVPLATGSEDPISESDTQDQAKTKAKDSSRSRKRSKHILFIGKRHSFSLYFSLQVKLH